MTGIVVGMKEPTSSPAILHWASCEATMRGLPLHVVHAWGESFEASVELTPEAMPDLVGPATSYAMPGRPATALLAHRPELLVLGGHSLDGRLSGTARECLRVAHCPVIVVPETERASTGRIVVGVDGDEKSRAALAWAADEARHRIARLVVVHAWQLHVTSVRTALGPDAAAPTRHGTGTDRLCDWVRTVIGNVNADLQAIHSGSPDTVPQLTDDADLIVTGHDRHAPPSPISHRALGLAPCPVALIPA
jgi:nucleotide-binding universal stress UspA family protein